MFEEGDWFIVEMVTVVGGCMHVIEVNVRDAPGTQGVMANGLWHIHVRVSVQVVAASHVDPTHLPELRDGTSEPIGRLGSGSVSSDPLAAAFARPRPAAGPGAGEWAGERCDECGGWQGDEEAAEEEVNQQDCSQSKPVRQYRWWWWWWW